MHLLTNPVILLIEDEPADVLLAQRAVRKGAIHADMHILNDGLDALDYLFGSAMVSIPSLVLLDLHLPRVSGLHILQRIRQNDETRSLPVAVLTSSELVDDREQSRVLGADLYVEKPITPAKLTALIQQLGIDDLSPDDREGE
jgi:two-component system, response regulator